MNQDMLFLKSSVPVKIVASELRKTKGCGAAATMLEHFDQLLSAIRQDQLTISLKDLEHGFRGSYSYLRSIGCGLGKSQIRAGIAKLVELGYLKRSSRRQQGEVVYETASYSLDRPRIARRSDHIQGRKSTQSNPSYGIENKPHTGSEIDNSIVRKSTHIDRSKKEKRTTTGCDKNDSYANCKVKLKLLQCGVSQVQAEKWKHAEESDVDRYIETAVRNGAKNIGGYVLSLLRAGASDSNFVEVLRGRNNITSKCQSPPGQEDKVFACVEYLRTWYANASSDEESRSLMTALIEQKVKGYKKLESEGALAAFKIRIESLSGRVEVLLKHDSKTCEELEARFGTSVVTEAIERFLSSLDSDQSFGEVA